MPRKVRGPDAALIASLRAGDESAFTSLVDMYSAAMLRLARMYVRTQAAAEDVVQEAWLGVLKGLDRFEGRSSLKTWIFRILTNLAKTRGERESRSVPFSSLGTDGEDGEGRAVDPDRFFPPGSESVGAWASPPTPWEDVPEERLLSHETQDFVAKTIEMLPEQQRTVITLRDVEGWSSEEVRNVLDITETNQRVLLHRARSKVRAALERYLDQGQTDG